MLEKIATNIKMSKGSYGDDFARDLLTVQMEAFIEAAMRTEHTVYASRSLTLKERILGRASLSVKITVRKIVAKDFSEYLLFTTEPL